MACPGRVFEDKDFVGVVSLDLDKTTQMASEEVSRISTCLASLSNEILMCESDQERRVCVKKAMRDYETAMKWVQVIVPYDEKNDMIVPQRTSDGVDLSKIATPARARPAASPKAAPRMAPNTSSSAPPPPSWSALGNVAHGPVAGLEGLLPPPPSHPPSLPQGRGPPAAQTSPQAYQLEVGSWSNRSSTTTLSPDAAHQMPQLGGLQHLQGPASSQSFHMDGAGSWSNRSSSVDSLHDFQSQTPSFDRHQQLQNQGARAMLNLNPMIPAQQSPTSQQQSLSQHPQQQLLNQIQQQLGHMMLPGAPAAGAPRQQQQQQQQLPAQQVNSMPGMTGMHNAQQMPGIDACGAPCPPGNFQVQVIAVPMGSPPPAGTILAAAPAPAGSIPDNQFQPMGEIFPQDVVSVASSSKFRIVNPNTGEEVQAPSDSNKNSKRFAIKHPGTGKEVVAPASQKENTNTQTHFGDFTDDENDENQLPVGVSWDWPLSRHEISERVVEMQR